MSQDVLLPCRRFAVEVTLGPHDGLTLVEQFVLRAILAGASRIESLAELLGLPPRMLLDTTIDLLSRGLLDVAADGALAAHETVANAVGDPTLPKKDWFLAFQSADLPEPRTIALFQDLVAGEVFLARRLPFIERQRLPTLPENADVLDLDEVPQGVLLSAVSQALRSRVPTSPQDDLRGETPPLPRDSRVLQVRLRRSGPSGGPVSHVDATRTLVPLQVQARDNGSTDPPEVRILGPSIVPSRARRNIESTLARLWLNNFGRGAGQFFDRLKTSPAEVIDRRDDGLSDPEGALARFDSLLSESSAPEVRHKELAVLDGKLWSSLEVLAGHRCDSRVVSGTARAFLDAALEALRNAKQQVLLSCPWIRLIGRSSELQASLKEAVRRGITVVLVWGIDRSVPPEVDQAWTFLRELERDAREQDGAILVAARGAESHAKLIVADMSWALVSSCNFLNSDPDRNTGEVGVRITSTDGAVPLSLQAMLSWARRLLPDYRIRERCLDAPLLFGMTEARLAPALGQTVLPPQTDLGSIGVQAWTAAWQRRRSELEAMRGPAQMAVLPVMDARHREILIDAVTRAKARIGIASHQVTIHGLSESLLEALLGACARGVAIRILHDAIVGADMDPAARERLQRISSAGATVTSRESHAKFLVCDEWALVSSHNFLSLDPGVRSAHELGVQIFARDAVDRLWAACSSPPRS